MRKLMIAVALCLAMLAVLAGPVLAQGAGRGAVKLPLKQLLSPQSMYEEGDGDEVGWAITNTNANGKLIVETHLDNGVADWTFGVWVVINETLYGPEVYLTTNQQGKGNAHVKLDIPDASDTIDVQVIVHRIGTPPEMPYGSWTGIYTTATQPVPLKK